MLTLLAVQSIVCIAAILVCKQAGLITTLAPFDKEKAKKCTLPCDSRKDYGSGITQY